MKPTNNNRCYKEWGTSVINSPLSPLSELKYCVQLLTYFRLRLDKNRDSCVWIYYIQPPIYLVQLHIIVAASTVISPKIAFSWVCSLKNNKKSLFKPTANNGSMAYSIYPFLLIPNILFRTQMSFPEVSRVNCNMMHLSKYVILSSKSAYNLHQPFLPHTHMESIICT